MCKLDEYDDWMAEMRSDLIYAQDIELKMKNASYWLESIVQRIDEHDTEELEMDVMELCSVLGVKPPRQKIKYV